MLASVAWVYDKWFFFFWYCYYRNKIILWLMSIQNTMQTTYLWMCRYRRGHLLNHDFWTVYCVLYIIDCGSAFKWNCDISIPVGIKWLRTITIHILESFFTWKPAQRFISIVIWIIWMRSHKFHSFDSIDIRGFNGTGGLTPNILVNLYEWMLCIGR